MYPEVCLQLPEWVGEFCESWGGGFESVEERARFVVSLARENVERDGGGPFAAAVFDLERGSLVTPGVNLVVPASCSVAHAEMVALMTAQQIVGTYNLRADGLPEMELVSSTEPCAMCMGAIPWSGVPRLVCCARGEDALAVGFDEGAKPTDWPAEMQKRGIVVTRDVLREDAADVLQEYLRRGGVIY